MQQSSSSRLVRPAVAAFGLSPADNSAGPDDGMLRSMSAVAGAGMMETNTYENLRELSDDIGARVTGSPEAARAIAWGLDKMKAAGLENVHAETWQLSRGWTRVSAHAEIVCSNTPQRHDRFSGMGRLHTSGRRGSRRHLP